MDVFPPCYLNTLAIPWLLNHDLCFVHDYIPLPFYYNRQSVLNESLVSTVTCQFHYFITNLQNFLFPNQLNMVGGNSSAYCNNK